MTPNPGQSRPPTRLADFHTLTIIHLSNAARRQPTPHFTFADLFCGIGGFRIALERLGGRCVFSCDADRHVRTTYHAWFGEMPHGDIRGIDPHDVPDHDVLAAGFPCQPFSSAGVARRRSLGSPHGLADADQGTLVFRLAAIIAAKRPRMLLLENVPYLLHHDEGRTWHVVRSLLTELGYRIHAQVMSAEGWVPQRRKRLLIVGFRADLYPEADDFGFPEPPSKPWPKLRDILEPNVPDRYTLSQVAWAGLRRHAARHQLLGNGFRFTLADLDGSTRTLTAHYARDGAEILVPQGTGCRQRRLTPRECLRLMGFPDDLPIVVSDTQAWRQLGNSVVVRMVEAVGRAMLARQSHRSHQLITS